MVQARAAPACLRREPKSRARPPKGQKPPSSGRLRLQDSGAWQGRLCGPQVSCGLLAAAPVGLNLVRDLLTLSEAAHTRTLDRADVNKHVLAALVGLNETIA